METETRRGAGIVRSEEPDLALELVPLIERAEKQRRAARSRNTEKAYSADWRDFSGWCAERGLVALPATSPIVRLYLADRSATLKVSTLQRRLMALRVLHRQAGHPDPTADVALLEQWKGLRREKGVAQKEAPALTAAQIRAIAAALPKDALGIRDRALLFLGFFGAFRRSEVVSLDVADLLFEPRGIYLTLRLSKTDQEGEGTEKAIPFGKPDTCPVTAVREWLRVAGISEGPVFRPVDRHGNIGGTRLSDKAVDRAVKRALRCAGVEEWKAFSGHSLRAGFVTSASEAGASDTAIMQQTGHKTHAMIAKYTRAESRWKNNAAALLPL